MGLISTIEFSAEREAVATASNAEIVNKANVTAILLYFIEYNLWDRICLNEKLDRWLD